MAVGIRSSRFPFKATRGGFNPITIHGVGSAWLSGSSPAWYGSRLAGGLRHQIPPFPSQGMLVFPLTTSTGIGMDLAAAKKLGSRWSIPDPSFPPFPLNPKGLSAMSSPLS